MRCNRRPAGRMMPMFDTGRGPVAAWNSPFALLVIFAWMGMVPWVALAQDYPQRPVRLVVPFSAGLTDTFGRVLAAFLGERLGQTVVAENRAGGGGAVGSNAVARATPDGYTLLLGSASTYGQTAGEVKRLPYDPEKDLMPVAMLARGANVFVVHPSVRIGSMTALIDYARANPGKLRYCSAGIGSNAHLNGALLAHRFGIDIQHVPYKGGAAGVVDLISGQIEMCISGTPTGAPHVKAGKLRALAVTSAARTPLMPEVPTMAEAGIPDFVHGPLFGVLAPAGTPASIVAHLARELVAVSRQPAFRNRLVEIGAESVEPLTGADFGRHLRQEVQRSREMAAIAGLKDD